MKAAEKEVLRAGMVGYVEHMLTRQVDSLREIRKSMHGKKSGKEAWSYIMTDWDTFYSLAKTQIMAIRRAQSILEAVHMWHELRTNLLQIVAVPERKLWPSGDLAVDAAIDRMKHDEERIGTLPEPDLEPLEALDDETLETIANFRGGNDLAKDEAFEAQSILLRRRRHPGVTPK